MLKSLKTSIWALVICAAITTISVPKATAQLSPTMSPTGAPDCMTMIYNMSDCLTYVEKGSKISKPDKPCCPELAGMLDSNPICLCQLLGKSKDLGIEFDVSKALKLPSVCGLQTPPISLCSVAGIPVGAPTSMEGPSSFGIAPLNFLPFYPVSPIELYNRLTDFRAMITFLLFNFS